MIRNLNQLRWILSSPYYKQLTNTTVQGEPLTTFLTKRFQRIGPTTAIKFAKFAGFKPEKRMGSLTNQELVNLSDSLQKFDDFMAPDSSCLAPLGGCSSGERNQEVL